jgi:hypothetical protein
LTLVSGIGGAEEGSAKYRPHQREMFPHRIVARLGFSSGLLQFLDPGEGFRVGPVAHCGLEEAEPTVADAAQRVDSQPSEHAVWVGEGEVEEEAPAEPLDATHRLPYSSNLLVAI